MPTAMCSRSLWDTKLPVRVLQVTLTLTSPSPVVPLTKSDAVPGGERFAISVSVLPRGRESTMDQLPAAQSSRMAVRPLGTRGK